jgi:hypothetical protein
MVHRYGKIPGIVLDQPTAKESQDNFFRAVRNFVIDIRNTTVGSPACIHWQVAQATSLENMHFVMNPDEKRNQVGVCKFFIFSQLQSLVFYFLLISTLLI